MSVRTSARASRLAGTGRPGWSAAVVVIALVAGFIANYLVGKGRGFETWELFVAGIVGALLAVPIVATLNTVVLYLHGHDKFPQLGRDDHVPVRGRGHPVLDRAIAQVAEAVTEREATEAAEEDESPDADTTPGTR